MTRARVLVLLGITFLILILGVGTAAWWYLFGPNKVDAAELVPGDTILFATIPNAATVVEGYQTSMLKQLVDSPNSQPISNSLVTTIGQKNIDVLNTFLPNLSGQSFFAITHFDADHPDQIGLIAAMKPKAGMGNFDAFLAKLKATWPNVLKQGTTGTGNVAGVDYQWLKGPGASDKVCVAQVSGWIVTAWGEASLQDWIERFHKKSATPSLAQNADYQKSIAQVGKDPMSLAYLNYHAVLDLVQKQLAKTNPGNSDYLFKKLASIGGLALGTRFEDGQIVDRFSCMIPRQAQIDSGMVTDPCPFETLKFTGPNNRLYWASSINWQQYWKNLQDQANQPSSPNPMATGIVHFLQNWAQGAGVDLQHNIIDPLGPEFSVQAEWNDDTTYPELGVFIKIAKPDDFKPTLTAIIEGARKAYIQSAVVTELNSNGQAFSALKFIQPLPVVPTITETGPYLGLFTSENLAVRSFARDEAVGLPYNDDFVRQIGDKRNGASQIMFVNTPLLLDRTYRIAMPYLSLLSMFNKDVAAWIQGKTLPPDLTWLAPMGTWSFVMTQNDAGVQGYSVSGIGNQGILIALTAGGAFSAAESMGMLPKMNNPQRTLPPLTPAVITPVPGLSPPTATAPTVLPGAAPDASSVPAPVTNSTPPAPDTTAPSVPSTNSDSTPATNTPTPDAPKPQ